MRRLMIDSILATDMGLHFKYMADLLGLKGMLEAEVKRSDGNVVSEPVRNMIDGWDQKKREQNRDLLCGLLIKCADICNVVSSVVWCFCTLCLEILFCGSVPYI